jgi:N-acetylmuramoyl-L-alanine amidase
MVATPRPKPRGTLYQLQVVFSVAFLVATLFTAWTPASLLPGSLAERFAQAVAFQATATAAYPTPTSRPRPLIGIVIGHWGDNNDPGAVCDPSFAPDLTEFAVNQAVAMRVRDNLSAEGFDVDLLKEFDERLPGYRALALISIHADSCQYINDEATGYKVAASLANPRPEKSARLTACLKDRYQRATGLIFHPGSITDDMTSYHAFNEIDEETTAVIIEVGFLNLDRQILTEGQDRVAKGITDGVLCYVRNENVAGEEQP